MKIPINNYKSLQVDPGEGLMFSRYVSESSDERISFCIGGYNICDLWSWLQSNITIWGTHNDLLPNLNMLESKYSNYQTIYISILNPTDWNFKSTNQTSLILKNSDWDSVFYNTVTYTLNNVNAIMPTPPINKFNNNPSASLISTIYQLSPKIKDIGMITLYTGINGTGVSFDLKEGVSQEITQIGDIRVPSWNAYKNIFVYQSAKISPGSGIMFSRTLNGNMQLRTFVLGMFNISNISKWLHFVEYINNPKESQGLLLNNPNINSNAVPISITLLSASNWDTLVLNEYKTCNIQPKSKCYNDTYYKNIVTYTI